MAERREVFREIERQRRTKEQRRGRHNEAEFKSIPSWLLDLEFTLGRAREAYCGRNSPSVACLEKHLPDRLGNLVRLYTPTDRASQLTRK